MHNAIIVIAAVCDVYIIRADNPIINTNNNVNNVFIAFIAVCFTVNVYDATIDIAIV